MPLSPDAATVQALRSDLALQISRCLKGRGWSQVAAAQSLEIPQPTLSKIMNGRVDELSLELLIRIAVRVGLSVVLQTGEAPEEAGVYVARSNATAATSPATSRLAQAAREALIESTRKLTPEQRLQAMLEQTRLVSQLHAAGRKATAARAHERGPAR
jgi:predicted XRE-type DNA-binding protein